MAAPMTLSEQRPPMAALVDDELAFRAWYDRTLPRVYGFLLARCGHDPALAEDLTQQAFIEVVRRRRQFDGRSDPATWVIAIARNKLVDHYRRLGRERRRDLRLVSNWTNGDVAAWHGREEREAIDAALATLSGDQRLVLILRYLDSMTVDEIARLIRRSYSATEALLFRAREAFRRAYKGDTDG
jgi:RNA polymerase sigma-70 factor, ECF subfamily